LGGLPFPGNYFGRSFSQEEIKTFNENKAVNQFLDDAQCFTLSVAIDKSSLTLDTKVNRLW